MRRFLISIAISVLVTAAPTGSDAMRIANGQACCILGVCCAPSVRIQ